MIRLGIEPRSFWPLANVLLCNPMGRLKSKVGDRRDVLPEGFLFSSYCTEVMKDLTPFFLCSPLPLILGSACGVMVIVVGN